MQQTSRFFAALGAALALSAAAVGAAAASAVVPPSLDGASVSESPDHAHVYVVGDVEIPAGEPDVVSVAYWQDWSANPSTSFAVAIRNNTADTVTGVEVLAFATDAADVVLGVGTLNFGALYPSVLAPGQWGVGTIYFPGKYVTKDATLEFVVHSTVVDPAADLPSVSLEISDVTFSFDEERQEVRIDGVATNTNDVTTTSHRFANACFRDGLLNGVSGTVLTLSRADRSSVEDLAPGDSTPFEHGILYYGPDPTDPCHAVALIIDGTPAP